MGDCCQVGLLTQVSALLLLVCAILPMFFTSVTLFSYLKNEDVTNNLFFTKKDKA